MWNATIIIAHNKRQQGDGSHTNTSVKVNIMFFSLMKDCETLEYSECEVAQVSGHRNEFVHFLLLHTNIFFTSSAINGPTLELSGCVCEYSSIQIYDIVS